jgi:glycosyltransferase involved in cell wall biosynthesis
MLLAQALAESGHEVAFWSSDFSHPLKRKRFLQPVESDYRVILVPTRPYKSNVCLARLRSHKAYARSWLEMAVEGIRSGAMQPPDLVLTSVPPLETGLVAQELRRRFGCKVVADVQDAWPETFYRLLPLPEMIRGFVGPVLFATYCDRARQVYQGADWVTGVAESYLVLAREYGAGQVSERPYYLGISLPADTDRVEQRDVGKKDILDLIYVGVLGRMHDLDTVIRYVIQNDRLRLHVAGAGPDERRLRDLAGSHANVVFHGYLDAVRLEDLLLAADVGVLPMTQASYVAVPNKLIDYVAHGLPVVSSLEGEAAALLEKHQAGVSYRAGDKSSFERAVGMLIYDRLRRKALRAGALRLAAERFDAADIYTAFVKELESVKNGMDRI